MLLAVLALGLATTCLAVAVVKWESSGWLAIDFKLDAAQRLVDGRTLYPTDGSGGYPYPPLWAMLVTPFLLLPELAAQYAAALVCAAAVLAAIWIVGVRDPYCFALTLCSVPLVRGAQLGNASCVVAPLVALAYRYNSGPSGLAIALKLYAWPLLLWAWLTRGSRDAFLGAAVAVVAVFLPWAVIGFDGITRYVDVASRVTANTDSYALPPVAAIVVTALALAAMWWRRNDPTSALAFAVAAMLAASPIVWSVYVTAAFVPLALVRPMLSPAWLVPVLLWGLGNDLGNRFDIVVILGLLAWCGVGAPTPRVRRPMRTARSGPGSASTRSPSRAARTCTGRR
jgi:hypothetical protein